MNYFCKKSRSALALRLLGIALLTAAASSAQAVPISSDLTISGSAKFDSAYAAGQLAGNASQMGNLNTTQAGVNSSSSFVGASSPALNPLSGAFTNTGDGLGFSGLAHGDDGGQYGIGIDLAFALANASLTNTYKVTFRVDFGHQVGATGDDSYTESEFFLEDSLLNQFFFTHLISDTVFGDELNGTPTANFGGVVSDPSAFATFDLILNPASSLALTGNWTLRSLINSGSADASLNAFISVDAIALTNTGSGPGEPGPTPAPEPATWILFLFGIATLVPTSRMRSLIRLHKPHCY